MPSSPRVQLPVLRSAVAARDHGEANVDSAAEPHGDAARQRIERGLREVVRGEVRFSHHDRMLYSTDASLYQVEPIGVVVPADTDDAAGAVRWCAEHGVAVLPRGGGTSLAGQATGVAVVVDLSAWCRGLPLLDVAGRTCVAEPGLTIDGLNRELASRGAGLFFPADPATTAQATVGGCIGNNAAGARSIRYGRTSENLAGVDVQLSTGERLWLEAGAGLCNPAARRLAEGVAAVAQRNAGLIRERFPRTVRRNAGYGIDLVLDQLEAGVAPAALDLSGLLCGSEGTLAVTLGARLKLAPTPRSRGLAVLSFATLEDAIEAVKPILDAGLPVGLSAVELLDDVVLDAARGNIEYARYVELLPGANAARREPKAVLYVEFFGFGAGSAAADEVRAGFDVLRGLAGPLRVLGMEGYADESAMLRAWKLRKAGEPLLHGLPGARKPITFVEDNAVPVERLGEFVREFKKIVGRHGTRAAYWAHASVGVLHVRPMIDLHDPEDRRRMRDIAVEVADLARACGGIMSGEHGDGKVRGPLLERFFGPELMRAFREVKAVFDPHGVLNPGNIVAPGPIGSMTENLRSLAATPVVEDPAEHTSANGRRHARPAAVEVDTFFDYEDQHGFQGAAEMCNGAGVCRKTSGGSMCPSYRGTLDERHATRGRGNALRLAVTGQIGRDAAAGRRSGPAWDDPDTLKTLDLCLSCKACKSECPSNVDIARLKAEYLAQSYRARGRVPLVSFLMAHIRTLNRLGSLTPALANGVAGLRVSRRLLRRVAKIDERRSLPRVERSLYAWMRRHARTRRADLAAPRVVVFADCFTAYNEPSIGRAAVRVLESLGYAVELLPREGWASGCCARPMISLGVLEGEGGAIAQADGTLEALRGAIEDPGVGAILVCEPSCLSAFKDDWLQLKLRTPMALRAALAAKAALVEDFVEAAWESHPRRPMIAAGSAGENADGAMLHGHCHQKALWGTDATARLLRRFAPGTGAVTVLDSGCCGMAGSFGYTADHFDLSNRIGELSVFPPVRNAADTTSILAPGTSCRHQIKDATGRRALHPIEWIARRLGLETSD